jgi:hypothetical protein
MFPTNSIEELPFTMSPILLLQCAYQCHNLIFAKRMQQLKPKLLRNLQASQTYEILKTYGNRSLKRVPLDPPII